MRNGQIPRFDAFYWESLLRPKGHKSFLQCVFRAEIGGHGAPPVTFRMTTQGTLFCDVMYCGNPAPTHVKDAAEGETITVGCCSLSSVIHVSSQTLGE